MKTNILSCIFAAIVGLFSINTNAKGDDMTNKKNLVVYFSRAGEQYSVGNITKGNTKIVAEIIAEKTGADLFEVKLQNDNYPADYTSLTEVAQSEHNAKARPEIIGDVENFADYDNVFVGSPIWWSDMPMALYTFIEKHDWSNKTVIPFTTHEGSGLGSVPANLKTATKANVLDGLATYGNDAQNNQDKVKESVGAWLTELGF